MHRRRGSDGLNWKPQRTFRACEGCGSDGENEGGVDAGGAT